MIPLANHLWQSTLFAAVAWLLAFAFKNQRAQWRYALWLAASLKFLIPFALLAEAGTWIPRNPAPVASPPVAVVYALNQPFSAPSPHPAPAPAAPTSDYLLPLILLFWASGTVAVAASAILRWRRLARLARHATPIAHSGIRVLSCPSRIEPGIFGILRPVLLLPAGIADRLTPVELESVIEHERCHIRRRDNLFAAIHMSVEAIFWFHPLVWWIGKQMILERERACDQEVLRRGADAESYAEGILKVCRLYLESPVACAAGVTGADLKNRIQQIMTARMPPPLDFGRKLLLTAAGLLAIATPVTIGMLNAPRLRAQPAEKLAFEVASVKENKSGDRQIQMQFLPGGKFVARNMPLWVILTTAFNLPFNTERITGQPEWVMGTRYDIEAGAPAGVIPPGASLPLRTAKTLPMLETLLEDRFKLRIRRQITQGEVYIIAVAKGGPKLQKSARDEKECIDATSDFGNSAACHSFGGGQGRGIHGEAASLSDLAAFVSNFADRPVIDKSGLSGLYKFDTEGWAPMRPKPPRPPDQEPSEEDKRFGDPSTPTLFTVFDRLGLKLESSKAPIETFVVERIERPGGN